MKKTYVGNQFISWYLIIIFLSTKYTFLKRNNVHYGITTGQLLCRIAVDTKKRVALLPLLSYYTLYQYIE